MDIKTKQEIDEIMKKEGDVRGEVLRDHFLYIKEKEGNPAIEKLEKILEEYGYPLRFSEIKKMDWYKDAYCGLILFILKEFFDWENDDFLKMGEEITKYSFIVTKIMLRYFISLNYLLSEAPNLWKKHVNFGELEVLDFDKEKKEFFLKIKDYDIHPLTCLYQRGYYKGLFGYVIKGRNLKVEEKKCIYQGDLFHLYRVSWE